MSRFRKKAANVYAQGALERGEFQPKGAPLKVYQYWHSRTKNAPENENFCHFWRVVAFWAPLMKVRSGLSRMAEKPVTWLFVFFAYAAAMIVLGITVDWFIPFMLLLLPYVIVGVAVGDEVAKEDGKISGIKGGVTYPFWVTSPISIPSFFIHRYAKGLSDRQAEVWAWVGVVGLVAAILGLIGFMITAGAMEIGWEVLYYVFGIPLGLVVVFFGIGGIMAGLEFLISKRHARKQRKKDEAQALREAQYDDYINGRSEYNPYARKDKHERVPSTLEQKVIGFLVGVGEFLSLAWNVVRVNKWKICPLVKIDQGLDTKTAPSVD